MKSLHVIWMDGPNGNVEHIAEHGVTPEEVEQVLSEPIATETSRTTGRPVVFGFTASGRFLVVVYEPMDETTVYPVTAFDVEN